MSVLARDSENFIHFCRRFLSEVGVRGWETSLDCEMYAVAVALYRQSTCSVIRPGGSMQRCHEDRAAARLSQGFVCPQRKWHFRPRAKHEHPPIHGFRGCPKCERESV
jgi:hypothetical protein